MVGFTGVLAHQGGWDEMLLIAAPIVIFVVLLRIANARAAHLRDDEVAATDLDDPDTAVDGPDPAVDGPDEAPDLDATDVATPTTDGGPSAGPDR